MAAWYVSTFDPSRHNFQLAAVWELPFGTGKPWATTGLSNAVLGGWQLNGVFSAYSGRPFTLTASGASLNMPHNQQTPDQIKDTVEILGNVGDATYFDTTAFKRFTEVRFGNVGRNTMRGPGQRNLDLSLFRTFKLPRTVDLQFRAEGFNIINTPHFSNPNGNVNSSNFGKIPSTDSNWAMGARGSFASGSGWRSRVSVRGAQASRLRPLRTPDCATEIIGSMH